MSLVTILTPDYNRAYSLPRLYQYLKAQTHRDFEWLVVDDGSVDDTRELMQGYIAETAFPIRYIRKYAGRQPLMHLKELGPDRKANVECGAGILDFASIITAGLAAGTEHFIVEQEEYTLPPLASCEVSLKNLLAL